MSYLNFNFDLDDEVVVSTLDESPWWSAPFGEKLFSRISLKDNLSVLDIGSGTGFPLAWVAGMVGMRSRLYGLDKWKAANKRTQKKLSQYGYVNAVVLCGAAEQMPFSDHTMDLLISNNGLNNVTSLEESLAECRRVCRSGAQLLATINLGGTMREFYDVFQAVLEEQGVVDAKRRVEGHITSKRPPLEEFTKAIEDAGFEVKNVEHDEFKWRYLNGSAMLNNYSIRLAFLPSWKALVSKGLLIPVFSEVEKRLNRIAEMNGEFVLTVPFVCIDAVAV